MYQAVILCLFNVNDNYTYAQVKENAAVPDTELKEALLWLCNPRMRLILKDNMKKPQFGVDENLKINLEFQNANLKCNFLPQKSHKKTSTEKTDGEKVDDKEIKLER